MNPDLVIARARAFAAETAYHRAVKAHKPSKALWQTWRGAKAELLKAEAELAEMEGQG